MLNTRYSEKTLRPIYQLYAFEKSVHKAARAWVLCHKHLTNSVEIRHLKILSKVTKKIKSQNVLTMFFFLMQQVCHACWQFRLFRILGCKKVGEYSANDLTWKDTKVTWFNQFNTESPTGSLRGVNSTSTQKQITLVHLPVVSLIIVQLPLGTWFSLYKGYKLFFFFFFFLNIVSLLYRTNLYYIGFALCF